MAFSNNRVKDTDRRQKKLKTSKLFYVANKEEMKENTLISYYGKKMNMTKEEITEFVSGNGEETLRLLKLSYLEAKMKLI